MNTYYISYNTYKSQTIDSRYASVTDSDTMIFRCDAINLRAATHKLDVFVEEKGDEVFCILCIDKAAKYNRPALTRMMQTMQHKFFLYTGAYN